MDPSGADKLILLVQTNQVLYDKSAAEYKVKDALENGDIWQIGVDIAAIVSVLLIYAAVSRFSFLGGGVTAPSDFSFLVSRSSFLVSRWRCDRALTQKNRRKWSSVFDMMLN